MGVSSSYLALGLLVYILSSLALSEYVNWDESIAGLMGIICYFELFPKLSNCLGSSPRQYSIRRFGRGLPLYNER